MERNWTDAQKAAMNTRNKTLLVSAAAGSGKTATLTQRIINSISDPNIHADISKMLIVTFTRAAADEMKSRIFAELSNEIAKNPSDPHLNNQLIKLGSAKICTIDSFYLELVRSNFSALGISASLRVGDGAELEVLAKTLMEETIDHFYDVNEAFPSFAECLIGTRSTGKLATLLLRLADRTASIPEGIDFLRLHAETLRNYVETKIEFLSTEIGSILRRSAMETVEYALSVFEEACAYLTDDPEMASKMLPSFDYDRTFCATLLEILRDSGSTYASIKLYFDSYAPVALKRMKKEAKTTESERYKELRSDLVDRLRTLRRKAFSMTTDDLYRAMTDTAQYTDFLYQILCYYQDRFTEEKNKRNVMDFNDIRRHTLRLLIKDGKPTDIARQYANQFTDIYIDEYQDVDRVQDLIFSALSSPTNRFMVGDIKQSIYSFRGAEPQVFSDYRAKFPEFQKENQHSSEAFTIFMSENFRCDENVIEFTNLVCSRIFSVCSDTIGYRKSDDLGFSKEKPSDEYHSPKVEIAVILNKKTDEDEQEELVDSDTNESDAEEQDPPEIKEREASYIASEIYRLISEEKKADGKPIRPGDIAVLFRSRSMSAYVSKALNDYGIASSESDGNRYFENPDVLLVLCLLNTVDNPHRDIFLTGTLRSPLFGFTMDDLIQIRSSCHKTYSLYDALLSYTQETDSLAEKCRLFDQTLQDMRHSAIALPIDRFLRILFESDLFVASGLVCDRNEAGDGGNLLRLYEYARTFESGSFKGLYNFIEFINTVIEEDKTMKIPPKGSSPDRVNLMTIHQSKGLEFPVCFVCGTGNRFNRQDQRDSLLFEYPLGVAMKISDSTGFARINTPMREALSTVNGIRQTEEEMRVLYVALTRARERLYITASSYATEEKLRQQALLRYHFFGRYTLLRCNSYLDWILLSLCAPTMNPNCCRLSFLSEQTESDLEEQTKCSELAEEPSVDPALLSHLEKKFAFCYPYSEFRRIPAKISVSRLSPDVLDEDNTAREIFPSEKKTVVPDFFITGKPARATATERGTATHLFLQFCDFSYAKKMGVKQEIARLLEKKFIPSNIAELIYPEELEAFFDSELATQIASSTRIIREQRFNLFLSAEYFSLDTNFRSQLKNEKLAVQGVIDLILIDREGRLCLYDYKTDRLSPAELADPSLAEQKMNQTHGLQLSYYAIAAEQLFGRPCEVLRVYSTHAGRLYDIHPIPLSIPDESIDKL